MKIQNILPGWKTKLASILVFVGGGLQAMGIGDIGAWLFNAGIALGFVGVRYAKK